MEAISGWSPDIITLQEVRGRHVDRITAHLSSIGLRHHYLSDGESDTQNGILIAAREPVEAGDFMEDREGLCHILEAEVAGLILLPVHFPQKAAQVPLFEGLARDTESLLAHDVVLLGDLNCGIPFEDSSEKTFVNTKHFQALKELGWVDLYRHANGPEARDFSWISPRTERGFRYDHALASPSIAQRVQSVQYDHSVRESGVSDHSALIVTLS